MQTCQLAVQVDLGEESPALLEGAALDEADAVTQLAQKLDACALEDRMDAVIKTEDTPPPGEAPLSARSVNGQPLPHFDLPASGQMLGACLLSGTACPSQQGRPCAAMLFALQGILYPHRANPLSSFGANRLVMSCCAALTLLSAPRGPWRFRDI